MTDQTTILQGILEDVSTSLYSKWFNSLPEDQRSEEANLALQENSKETTFFVIQMYMNKINEAGEALRSSEESA